MSPEQIRGDKVDARADVYAIGALLFHMLTGRPPFAGKSHTVVQYMHLHGQRPRPSAAVKVSAAVDEVISQAMAPDREQRFASVADLVLALRSADDSSRASRRTRRAKHTQSRALGVYLDVRIRAVDEANADDTGEEDDHLLDQMDAVLDEAERHLLDSGFHVGLEGSNSTLYVRVLTTDKRQEVHERRAAVTAVAQLHKALDKRLGTSSPLHVNLCMHRDFALISDGEIHGGDLMRLERWAPDPEIIGVVGSPSVFTDLGVETEPADADGRLLRWLIPDHRDLFVQNAADDSRQLLMHTQMLAQIGRQVTGIVHDLRSPLTVIQGNLDLTLMALEDDRPLTVNHQKGLQDALDATHKLADIVATILRASTIKSYGSDRRRLAVSAVIDAAVQLSRGQTRSRADLEIHHGTDLHVVGSPGRLTQVVVNLLVYMAQAMKRRAVIVIQSSRNQRGKIVIAIQSDGITFDEDVKQQIFGNYHAGGRSDPSTGLGLSLVREILEAHGGTISIHSNPETPSALVITLPAAD